LLLDVALAAVLAVAALGEQATEQRDLWWLILVVPPVVGLAIRRLRPLLAFTIAAAGTVAIHVDPNLSLTVLDVAAPLCLYTLANTARTRRTAALALAAAMLGVGLVSLLHVLVDQGTTAGVETPSDGKDGVTYPLKPFKAGGQDDQPAPVDAGNVAVAAAGRGAGAMLALGLAAAVGDGVRSRRIYLRSLEQRAADLEREQNQRVALATAAERARITRELHDVVAHGLSVIVVQAQGGAAALERHPERTAEALQNVITTGRQSLTEMRRLLDVVRREPAEDPELAPQPGIVALPALVDRVRAAGTPVSFTVDGRPTPLPTSVDLSAYRIAQEALTNTIKHAGAGASAAVRLHFSPAGLEIEVTDDGVGGPIPAGGGGTGLRGIAERIGILGGELIAGPGESGGFRVRALLPLSPA
jgi:signal transduction histidine kinase